MSERSSANKLVCYGEILWDILPAGELPGGAPMNVAYHLHKLKRDVSIITAVGSDSYGAALVNLLSKWGIGTEYCHIDHYHPTGIVYARSNEHFEMTYDIVYPSAWDFIIWDDRYVSLMQDTDYLVFGSLACRNYTSGNTLFKLLESAKNKVLDINIRPPHFSRKVVEQLLHKSNILKLNQAELELIAGWFSTSSTVADKIKAIQDRFRLKTIVVTMGSNGAVLCMDGHFYQHPGYKVQVADTVGSGDAFLAALLSKLIEGAPPEAMLHYACAMGALIASYPGACPHYQIDEIVELNNFSNIRA
ncbi:carbohydrate kinase [Niastella caeni]|uniref:Carbohydrate kinase n=1 Tax=Niastella caeni TaxID=2569763 RepID=A0A4V4H0D2_9BACT|nr:carbohydrate kinase [Niastella caeni]THU36096.1 carbohydrate kinase [Niastella caeni]